MKYVNQPVRKKDAMQLVTGQPVYVDDIAPKDCLIVKLLRSPYANAMVTSVNKAAAMTASRQSIHGRISHRTEEDILRQVRPTRSRARMIAC